MAIDPSVKRPFGLPQQPLRALPLGARGIVCFKPQTQGTVMVVKIPDGASRVCLGESPSGSARASTPIPLAPVIRMVVTIYDATRAEIPGILAQADAVKAGHYPGAVRLRGQGGGVRKNQPVTGWLSG